MYSHIIFRVELIGILKFDKFSFLLYALFFPKQNLTSQQFIILGSYASQITQK